MQKVSKLSLVDYIILKKNSEKNKQNLAKYAAD